MPRSPGFLIKYLICCGKSVQNSVLLSRPNLKRKLRVPKNSLIYSTPRGLTHLHPKNIYSSSSPAKNNSTSKTKTKIYGLHYSWRLKRPLCVSHAVITLKLLAYFHKFCQRSNGFLWIRIILDFTIHNTFRLEVNLFFKYNFYRINGCWIKFL